MRSISLAALALIFAQPASAEMVQQRFTAPNGVVVDVRTDDFAGRREYASPFVVFSPDGGGDGKAMVGEVFADGKLQGLTIQGFLFYSGDWRFYSSAIYKGGTSAEYHRTGSDVVNCSGGCTLSEDFLIELTPQDVKAHSENGTLAVQLRSDHGNTAIISIPTSYFEAVEEVAH